MNKKLTQQLSELEEEMKGVAATQKMESDGYTSYRSVDQDMALKWKVKVKNLLVKICGTESEQYKSFTQEENTLVWSDNVAKFNALKAIFLATKEDFEAGYISSYKTMVQAEVFDTELEQANELLKGGYYVAAAIIAGVVLETTLRELCDREKIEHGKMDKMNADLAKANIYNKIVQKQITTYAGIRNSAAHGIQNEFAKNDVEQMIVGIENFLASHLDS